jgi:hypothetical protein
MTQYSLSLLYLQNWYFVEGDSVNCLNTIFLISFAVRRCQEVICRVIWWNFQESYYENYLETNSLYFSRPSFPDFFFLVWNVNMMAESSVATLDTKQSSGWKMEEAGICITLEPPD